MDSWSQIATRLYPMNSQYLLCVNRRIQLMDKYTKCAIVDSRAKTTTRGEQNIEPED